MTPVMPAQCQTCIFRHENRLQLRPGRLEAIRVYLIRGTAHLCHSAPQRAIRPRPGERVQGLACRGGRDFQLQCWHRMGILPEPTDAALAAAMEAHLGPHP